MATDQETRLRAVLDQLEKNQITLPDAAREVRTMHFPPPEQLTAWQRQLAAYGRDLHEPDHGSFFLVSQAYTAGRITRRQYEVLAEAAADAIERQHAPENGHGTPGDQAQAEVPPQPGQRA